MPKSRTGTLNKSVDDDTQAKWDHELSRSTSKARRNKRKHFTPSLYHAFLTPNLYEDVNGEYRGLDQNVHQAKGFTELHGLFACGTPIAPSIRCSP